MSLRLVPESNQLNCDISIVTVNIFKLELSNVFGQFLEHNILFLIFSNSMGNRNYIGVMQINGIILCNNSPFVHYGVAIV